MVLYFFAQSIQSVMHFNHHVISIFIQVDSLSQQIDKEISRRSECQAELTKANEQLALIGTNEKQLQKVFNVVLRVSYCFTSCFIFSF